MRQQCVPVVAHCCFAVSNHDLSSYWIATDLILPGLQSHHWVPDDKICRTLFIFWFLCLERDVLCCAVLGLSGQAAQSLEEITGRLREPFDRP